MTEDRFQAKLGDYLDGSLGDPERREVEAHVESCESCGVMVRDLTAIKKAAASLDRLPPPESLWTRIEDSLPERAIPSSSALHSATHVWALAATLLILLVGLFVMYGLQLLSDPTPPEGSPEWVSAELHLAEEHYQNAIRGLEAIVEGDQSTLDPEVMAVLRRNLTLIEDAIGESRTAARQEPANAAAGESLLAALRRKVSLLQNTVLLINEVRKGRGENALGVIDKMRESENPNGSNPS